MMLFYLLKTSQNIFTILTACALRSEKVVLWRRSQGLIVGGMTDLEDTDVPFGKTIEALDFGAFQEPQNSDLL